MPPDFTAEKDWFRDILNVWKAVVFETFPALFGAVLGYKKPGFKTNPVLFCARLRKHPQMCNAM